jgi:hypothetical protein
MGEKKMGASTNDEYSYRAESDNDDELADIIQRARPALERAYSLEIS